MTVHFINSLKRQRVIVFLRLLSDLYHVVFYQNSLSSFHETSRYQGMCVDAHQWVRVKVTKLGL